MFTHIKTSTVLVAIIGLLFTTHAPGAEVGLPNATSVKAHWFIQSSAIAKVGGERISRPDFIPAGWVATEVPATVAGALTNGHGKGDVYFGMNLRSVPGTTYPIDKDFYHLEIPEDSPFKVSWWYQTRVNMNLPAAHEHIFLRFKGINYSANIWFNGIQIGTREKIVGAFRQHEFEVTSLVAPENALAAEVFAQGVDDLAPSWIDWNPAPGDKGLGLWRGVEIFQTGQVRLKNTTIVSKINLPSATEALVKVATDVVNLENKPIEALVRFEIAGINLKRRVTLGAAQTKPVKFFVKMNHPHLWWPRQMGVPYLYRAHLDVIANGKTSDIFKSKFGIREIGSKLISNQSRVFMINGKRLFIRGGGWAPDLFLNSSDERERKELEYVADLNLNTVRFEGKFETDHFLDLADEMGILTMPGWACCTQWEYGVKWNKKHFEIAEASFRDQLARHINHPSSLVWLYGSDYAPPPPVEEMYLRVLRETGWPNPAIASARDDDTLAGKTGVKMTGPYDYVPPSYWYDDKKFGGAFGFNTETSVGPAVPPIESLKQMLPADHLWPIDDVWNFHAGTVHFQQIRYFTEALNRRYGEAHSVEEYAMKAQVLAYDGHRAMFEAYTSQKYKKTTGVIQWMLNNAWPSMIWHLYDYYLRPGGSYFGAKKALEPIHIQYAYDSESVDVVNSSYEPFKDLTAHIELLDFNLNPLTVVDRAVNIAADSVKKIDLIHVPANVTSTYFLRLSLNDKAGRAVSQNFYWLSTQKEVLDYEKTDFTHTPTLVDGDLRMLNSLPAVEVLAKAKRVAPSEVAVTLTNKGKQLAFAVRLKLTSRMNGEEILPALWQDNYVALMPGETRTIKVRYDGQLTNSSAAYVELSGWNVASKLPLPVEP